MKDVLSERDKIRIKQSLNIDIDKLNETFQYLDDIIILFKEYKIEVLSKEIESLRRTCNLSYFNSCFKERKNYISSFSYYLKIERYEFEKIKQRNNPTYHDFDRYKGSIIMLLCSFDNIKMRLSEEVYLKSHSPDRLLLLFEACPLDMNDIDARNEILEIRSTCLNKPNGIFPIVRFATNINTFKNTCNKYKINYLHFACHGEGNGDLGFIGYGGKHRFLGFEVFKRYFSIEYPHKSFNISFVYFNSCFSSKFIDKMVQNKLIPRSFDNALGCSGINEDCYALKFSLSFYDNLANQYQTNSIGEILKITETSSNFKNCKNYLSKLYFI